jgi:putative membrane protein
MRTDLDPRDELAVGRTHLSNERTLLAYSRTGLALVATGAGLVEFIAAAVAQLLGWAFIGLGVMTMLFGVWRFFRVREDIRRTAFRGIGSPKSSSRRRY